MVLISVKERVTQALNTMSDHDLRSIEKFVTFLRFRTRLAQHTALTTTELISLYAADTDEDRSLANDGMMEYQSLLAQEDQTCVIPIFSF